MLIGQAIKEIVRRLGHSRQLVRRVIRGERQDIFRTRQSSLERHLPWLDAQWSSGCRNGADLWRRLKGQGFRGSLLVSRQPGGHAHRELMLKTSNASPRLDAKIVVVSTIPGLGGSRTRPLDRSRVRLARVEDRMLDALKMREGRKWKVADQAGSKTPSISRTWTRLFPSFPPGLELCLRRVVGARCRHREGYQPNSTIYLVLITAPSTDRSRRSRSESTIRNFLAGQSLVSGSGFQYSRRLVARFCGGHRSRAGLADFVEDWGAWGQGRFRRSPRVALTDN
jgi:hypothetical protein